MNDIMNQWNVMMPAMVLLAVVPFLVIMLTSYLKLVVVLAILRNAIGIQNVPPAHVVNGLALILTIYIMSPVITKGYEAMQKPQMKGKNTLASVIEASKEPLREFLMKHASRAERIFFVKSAHNIWPEEQAATLTDRDLLVLIPAFTVSELTEAFKIGFFIYLPFVVIDMVVSTVLLAMGMMMVPPSTISVPLKLLLLVLMDGWVKLIHSLILTYS
jgi:type III secretion protein R